MAVRPAELDTITIRFHGRMTGLMSGSILGSDCSNLCQCWILADELLQYLLQLIIVMH